MIKFHQKEVLSNVSSFKISNNHLAYCSENTIYLNKVKIVEGTISYFFYQNRLYFHQNSNTFFLNEENDIIKIADFSFNFDTLFENTIIISSDLKVENLLTFEISSIYELVNVSTFNIEKRLPHRYSDILGVRYENQYFSSNIKRTTLRSLSLLTGEYEWEVELGGRKYIDAGEEKAAKIKQLVGIWQNQLIVTMTHGELMGIDISTGQIVFETHQLGTKIMVNESYKWSGFFDSPVIENGKLYELAGSLYYCIDLQTQAVEILWQDTRQADYVTAQHCTYAEDYVYFTGSYNNRFQPHLIGVFNRKSVALEWVEDMNLPIQMGYPPSLNQAPQVAGNKLYVLDSGGTLHIFEKEPTT